ncbi:NAD-glutamate dehydrogenase [Hoeflea sp. TYP-13]|uniref:NAD-glutamate dehydrogenase n=1 Tax=Hoeflea sp. TYP-13 TaxID=3230023 RepID=UPI0034C68A83
MGTRRHPKRDKQIARIAEILNQQKNKYIDPDQLLGHVSADDVLLYRPESLAAACIHAHEQIEQWNGDNTRIFVGPVEGIDLAGRSLTVVSIVDHNMPFIYDSIMGEVSNAHRDICLAAHPVIKLRRATDGAIKDIDLAVAGQTEDGWQKVSVVQIHLPRLSAEAVKLLKANLLKVLDQVHRAVADWRVMLEKLDRVVSELQESGGSQHLAEREEALAFLEWLRDDNFTFLGMREYHFRGTGKEATVERAEKTGLGILSDPDVRVLRRGTGHVTTTPELLAFLQGPDALIVTKANVRSLVHRRTYMDYVGVKRYDESGRVTGELRIVGLFTSTAYTRSVQRIPLLRSKANAVVSSFGFDKESHSGKVLLNALESYPRDELFQIDVPMLAGFCEQIIELSDRPRVRVLPRIDRFDRFVSVLVYVPRDQYDTDARGRIGAYLKDVFDARLSAYYPAFPEGGVARVHFVLGRSGGRTPRVSQEVLENTVRSIVTRWEDQFAKLAGVDSLALHTSDAYRDNFTPEEAVEDLPSFLQCAENNPICIDFYQRDGEASENLSLKIFHLDAPVSLSRRVPLLENLGFSVISEQTFEVAVGVDVTQTRKVVLHNMELVHREGMAVDLARLVDLLDEAFLATWYGRIDNDGFNRLVINSGLTAREVTVLRAYARYLRQAGITYSQGYIAETLNRYPEISSDIFNLFRARFDPSLKVRAAAKEYDEVNGRIETALARVPSLDEDRIFRRLVNVISSTLRTNYYQQEEDGAPRATMAFKLDPRSLDGIPDPCPYREIFVYGSDVEGVHLRFGPIARGGLRWSDRAQDYRTEVLGLVKAQQVKNAVIVPVGSKGGFYPKNLPASGTRDDIFNAGRNAYKIFISTLLSVTDNIVDGKVVSPKNTLCHDDDDPYFVVAADKGTATFSDTANAISQEHHFWLDDAFASGGSDGYDHKKMGITARGAWEAVERHFREMDIDIQTTEFTVAGVGDMSGDVFGNGMLLSPKIRLVAAFDHRDIFIDPNPDCKISFAERKRLFEVGRSSWQDYNQSLLSPGGMIISRTEKSVTLSKQAAAAIGLSDTRATPFEIIIAILKAEIDLLWFGGIGTYIKAVGESDADVGDRTNDAVRITADQVGAKVIGEGANLGVTQLGRIAFNMRGGRCNSDAIDNSAGVSSSDLEVNIKIALAAAMRAGRLSLPNRNKLLIGMTDEVAALVLRNNYLQTLAISLVERRSARATGDLSRLMNRLETYGHLDRTVETLPDNQTLAERVAAGKPLTRAEIGVLLSYAKIVLFDDLTNSALLDDPYFESELIDYFPKRMHKTHAKDIREHRLRREIIGTVLANDAINRGSPVFISRLVDATGMLPSDIVKSYVMVRDGLSLPALYDSIDALDNKVPGEIQNELYAGVGHVIQTVSRWALKTGVNSEPLAPTVKALRAAVDSLELILPSLLPGFMQEETKRWYERAVEHGVPKKLATRLSQLPSLALIPEIMQIAKASGADLKKTAKTFFDVTELFRISRMDTAAHQANVSDHYEALAIARSLDEITAARRSITTTALENFGTDKDTVAAWHSADQIRIDRGHERISELIDGGEINIARLTVAAGMMGDIARGRN